MSKFHSTMSRRDFMKGLGLAGAGLGAAAAAVPVFHDLDELASKGAETPRSPWWVKEREYMNPTTAIDWARMERFKGSFDNFATHLTPEHAQQLMDQGSENMKNHFNSNTPARDIRSKSLREMGWARPYGKNIGLRAKFLCDQDITRTPEQWGGPKWEGTPEESARMIRAAGMFAGSGKVTFGVLDEKTKKLINVDTMEGGPNNPVVFENVKKPYLVEYDKNIGTPGKMVIPDSFKYVIVLMIKQDLDMVRADPSGLIAGAGWGKGYGMIEIVRFRMINFLNGIGYYGVGGDVYGLTAGRPAWGALFGQGELCRLMELSTPEYGPGIRTTMIIPTDLPLPVTNPIEFGMARFCDNCLKCADACPANAIYRGDRDFIRTPADSTAGMIPPDDLKPELFNNSPGYERWPLNQYACRSYWTTNGSACAICQVNCVFCKHDFSTIHEAVKPIIANTTALNGFFLAMDKAYGYGPTPEERYNDFWEKERPVLGTNY